MRIVLVALGLVVLLAVGWVLKGLMSDRDERDFAVHYSWIVKWALTLSRDTQRAPAGASFDSPRIEVAGHPKRWVVSGKVNWRDALGSPVSEPYTAVVENICKAYADPDCWRLEGFAMGEPAIDLAEATLAGSTTQVAQAEAAPDAAAPADAQGAAPEQQVAAAPAPAPVEPDPVLGLLDETAAPTPDGSVPDAPPLPTLAQGLPLPERKPLPPVRIGEEDVAFALADAGQQASDEDSLAAIEEASRPAAGAVDTAAALADSGDLLSDADSAAALAQTQPTQAEQDAATAVALADTGGLAEPEVPVAAVEASPAPAAENPAETDVAVTEPASEPAPAAPAPQPPVTTARSAPQPAPVIVPAPQPTPVIAPEPEPTVAAAPTPQPLPVPSQPAPATAADSAPPTQPAQATPPAAPTPTPAPAAQTQVAAAPPSEPEPEPEPEPEIAASAQVPAPAQVAALPPQPERAAQPEMDPAIVVLIQDRLDRAGYDPGPVDGRFGGRTQAALREFERDAGLPVTGAPSRTALAALDRLLASRSAAVPAPAPKPQIAALPPARIQAPAPTPPVEPSAPAVLAPAPAAAPPPPASTTANVAPTPVRTPAKPTNLIQPAPGASQPTADESLIFLIQHRLRQAGFSPGRFDGRMSDGTSNAIRAYQGRNGLPVDGVPSRALLERLESDVLGGEQRQPMAPTPLGYIPCETGSGAGCSAPPA